MSQSFTPFQSSRPESPAPACGAAIYAHPNDVTSDPKLTTAEKRAVLASWCSDARAIENAPSLRRLDSSAVVEVDAILRALGSLDELAHNPRGDRKLPPPSGRRRSVISKLLRRGVPPGSSDDDDDPPPAPAGFGVPFCPKPLPPAHGAWMSELACATG